MTFVVLEGYRGGYTEEEDKGDICVDDFNIELGACEGMTFENYMYVHAMYK